MATINVRMREEMKCSGDKVLERAGVSITELVRRLYELIIAEQTVPEILLDQSKFRNESAEIERKRAALQSLAGIAPFDINCNELISEQPSVT